MKARAGGLLKQWGAVLLPVLLYLLLGLGMQTLLLRAGLTVETAKAASACVFPLPAVLWYFFRKDKLPRQPRNRTAVSLCMAAELAGVILCLAVTAAWADQRLSASAGALPVSLLSVLGFGIAGPVTEEILYRGVVFQRCAHSFGLGWAVLLSTMLFAAAHQTLLQACMSLVAGAVFCLIYLRWRTLLAPIAVHIGVNLCSFFPFIKYVPADASVLGILALTGYLVWAARTLSGRKKRQDKGERYDDRDRTV